MPRYIHAPHCQSLGDLRCQQFYTESFPIPCRYGVGRMLGCPSESLLLLSWFSYNARRLLGCQFFFNFLLVFNFLNESIPFHYPFNLFFAFLIAHTLTYTYNLIKSSIVNNFSRCRVAQNLQRLPCHREDFVKRGIFSDAKYRVFKKLADHYLRFLVGKLICRSFVSG